MDMASAIQSYLNEYDGYGRAWDILWDYKCEVQQQARSILDREHVRATALNLFAYLTCFGMARSSTRLTEITIDNFEELLLELPAQSYKALLDVTFERLAPSHREIFDLFWRALQDGLKKCHVSATDTMITKILMGIWGETPAFDTYFRAGFRSEVYRLPTDPFRILLKLREKYESSWAHEIRELRNDCFYTRRGYKNRIPVARLLDMGLWYLGSLEQ